MKSGYYVETVINGERFGHLVSDKATLHSVYKAGKMLVRYGKRNHVPVRFIAYNADQSEILFWLFARESVKGGWVAQHSSMGKYGSHCMYL